jgi:hypothetical protein
MIVTRSWAIDYPGHRLGRILPRTETNGVRDQI